VRKVCESTVAANKVVLDGEKVRRLREQRGLSSQGDLAHATVAFDAKRGGLAPRTVWDAENGKQVTGRTHLLVARALEVEDPNDLLVSDLHAAAPVGKRARQRLTPAGMTAALLIVVVGASLAVWGYFKPGRTPVAGEGGAQVGLDTAVWTVNGSAARAALANMDAPRARIVQPTLAFSPNLGLGMTGIDGTYEMAGIQTTKPFRPPFTVNATVMATAINAGAFQLLITSADGGHGLALVGGQGANDVFTGLNVQIPSGSGTHWTLRKKLSEPRAPSLNVWYDLEIVVDISGTATVSGGPQGSKPHRDSLRTIGTGPFYVVLSQGSGAHGPGPNQAYWRAVSVRTGVDVAALPFRRDDAGLSERSVVASTERNARR
jgi:hypothetical protein